MEGSREPLVSVVITTYNQAAFIEETVSSALAQHYGSREVIVVDDGSTDETAARLSRFGGEIVYIRQANQGVAGSRNTGVQAAKGHLIAFLDGDDTWEADKLSAQVDAFRRHPDSGMIVVDAVHFAGAHVLKDSVLLSPGRDFVRQGGEIVCIDCYPQMLEGNFIPTISQVMVPAAILRRVGSSDRRFTIASDYDLYLRIAAAHPVTFVKRPLAGYRYVATSVSGPAHTRGLRCAEDVIAALKKHRATAPANMRPAIGRALNRQVVRAAELAYNSTGIDRRWARRYLARLAFANLSQPWAAVFLFALWTPRRVLARWGPSVRRLAQRRAVRGDVRATFRNVP